MTDHSSALESLAALHCRCPLTVLEWFLEVAESHELAGMSRDYSERTALADVERQLEGRSASAARQTQCVSTSISQAGAA